MSKRKSTSSIYVSRTLSSTYWHKYLGVFLLKYPSVGLGQIFRIGEEFYVVTEVGDEGVVLEDSKGDGREYSYEDLVREEAAIVNDIGEVKYYGIS